MSTAIIVVSLPSLKFLIIRSTPTNTSNRSTNGYKQTSSGKPGTYRVKTARSHFQDGRMDDEAELTFLDRKPSPSPTGTTTGTETQDAKDSVMVTTDVTITRELF
jgi:hypothetical protein